MIYYPIQTLVDSGIDDILLVCGGNAAGEFLRILGNGEEFGLRHLHYTYQKEAKGIADALGLAQDFIDNEPCCVILADNILQNNLKTYVDDFRANPEGARIFLTQVKHPEHYGVVEIDESGTVLKIEEKPKQPKSNWIAAGVYMYDNTVWDFIDRLKPSARNELEITDLNNHFLSAGKLKAHKLEGWWADCGEDFDSYLDAGIKARELGN